MIASTFFDRWIWPAGGSGGIPGDVVATFIWIVLAAIATSILYPPLRKAVERFIKRHFEAATAELHAKLDHIIEHHPDIPPYISKDALASQKQEEDKPSSTS
jgi:transcription elongation factor GreA-like protein